MAEESLLLGSGPVRKLVDCHGKSRVLGVVSLHEFGVFLEKRSSKIELLSSSVAPAVLCDELEELLVEQLCLLGQCQKRHKDCISHISLKFKL